MSSPDHRRPRRRAVARLGAVAALVAGVGAAVATGAAAESAPPPAPPPASAPPAAPPAVPVVPAGPWDGIARCETGGDWHADTGNGYQGGLQLSPQAWTTHGGGQFAPRADQASREQQIVVADRVRAEQGWAAWSSCAAAAVPG